MCGFLGEISHDLIEKTQFLRLLQLSYQRGPDQQGYWCDGKNAQLGFNRLAIIDTSLDGLQPMVSPSGRFMVVFNGEIYNYKSLQGEFGISNGSLRSNSDTEILVQLLDLCGVENVAKRINGMFAIAIYDKMQSVVHLIRDFAGIKPLFYGFCDGALIFASQFDQVFKHPKFQSKKKLVPSVVKEYFALGYMPAPHTVYQDIFQVAAGEHITWSLEENHVIHRGKYYDWSVSNSFNETSEDGLNKFDEVFSTVIHEQLHADVPVATFLSGGIDSPLVSAYCVKSKPDITSFTVGVDDPLMDESRMAARYASKLGITNYSAQFSEVELLDVIDRHFGALSEPFGDYSSLPTFLITGMAKKFATVMMSGDGGDELFWGYPRFLTQIKLAKYFRYPLAIRRPMVKSMRWITGSQLSYGLDNIKEFSQWTLNFQMQLFRQDLDLFLPDVNYTDETMSLYHYGNSLDNDVDVLRWLKWNEFYGHLQRVLRKVDLASMGNALEVRVPFLDKRCINFSNNIKPELGTVHQELKYVLKKALERKVPKDIVQMEKKGFTIPIAKFLRRELRDDLFNHCIDLPLYGNEILDTDSMRKFILAFIDNHHDNAWGVWHIYAWQKWAHEHVLNN